MEEYVTMQLTFGGGASEVGASFIVLKIDDKNIALDCGIRMNTNDSLPDFSFLGKCGPVDAIILSHAHMDHSGALPILSREYPYAKIYMTHATKDLIRVLLYDSLKIMDHRESEIPIFAETHVKAMLDNIVCYSPAHTIKPFSYKNNVSEIEITFYGAGHVAGAAGVYICGAEGSFFYSGDFSATPQMTVEGASFPKLRPDIAVLESTYGDRLHASRDIEESRLIETISAVISRKGKLLIPAFSLGRAQEIILIINRALNKKQLPGDLRVYVDGMVNDICRVFSQNPNYLSTRYGKRILRGADIFFNDNVIPVNKNKNLREEIAGADGGSVIVSSSGMLTGGPSQWYAEKLAGNENNYIALTGYQDEESPGRRLLEMAAMDKGDKERVLKIGDKTVPVKCEIGLYGLSAHADKMEIINLAHALAAKHIFLNHGSEEVVNSLGAELQNEYRGVVYIPGNGETFDIAFKNKRKQSDKSAYEIKTTMPAPPAGADENEFLWEFILANYGTGKAFTMEDLYFVRYGEPHGDEESFIRFRAGINGSPYFEAEKKRPFMFHAIEEGIFKNTEGEPMEVNKMLALAGEYFPPDTGLYKKGARTDTKTALLYFNFPIAALKNNAGKIKVFEIATRWKTEINGDCNLGAAERLIASMTGGKDNVKSCSYYRAENAFKVSLEKMPESGILKNIQDKFYGTTGIELLLSPKTGGAPPPPVSADKKMGQMEQNRAFQFIDGVFSSKPHKLYKKSLKIKNGEKGIELSFISPSVGALYRGDIDEIETKTRWRIWINPETNQYELMNTAREFLDSCGVSYKKLSYLADKNSLQVVFDREIPGLFSDDNLKTEIIQKFTGLTGVNLII